MAKLRVGVIGLGMGRGHIKGYKTHPDCEVAAICDVDSSRLKWVGDEFGVANRYTSSKEMFAKEKLDVVSVATPNKFHMPLTLEAIKAGAHVLCEKPMAMSAGEARRMLAAAQKAKRHLMINFSYRFNEQSQTLKKQVESGILGDVYFARTVWHRRRGMPGFGGWFGTKALSGGGPLIDLGVHRLDLALWLMGYPKPAWVMGSSYNHLATVCAKRECKTFDVEDLAVGLVKFENGATLEIEASWAANIAEQELMETRLLGTSGGLVQRNLHEDYKFEAEIYVERDGALYDMKLHPPFPPCPSAYYCFIDTVLGRIEPVATGREGLIVMELLDAIYKSAQTGKPVHIADGAVAAKKRR